MTTWDAPRTEAEEEAMDSAVLAYADVALRWLVLGAAVLVVAAEVWRHVR